MILLNFFFVISSRFNTRVRCVVSFFVFIMYIVFMFVLYFFLYNNGILNIIMLLFVCVLMNVFFARFISGCIVDSSARIFALFSMMIVLSFVWLIVFVVVFKMLLLNILVMMVMVVLLGVYKLYTICARDDERDGWVSAWFFLSF